MKVIRYISLLAVASIVFISCKKDDNKDDFAKPAVNSIELGYGNNKIAYIGSDLHIEAIVEAEAKIHTITVSIHPEGEHQGDKIQNILNMLDEWEFDTVFNEFQGLKNTTFHKHIDIPITADTGIYHFHLTVSDLDGQQYAFEDDLHITVPQDSLAPVIVVNTAPTTNETFTNGQTISISGSISDDNAIGGLYIGLVRVSQNLSDTEVNATNTITLLHTHDFSNPENYEFTASINVGAIQDNNIPPKDITGEIEWQSSEYYILVKSTDAFGGNWGFSIHYPLIISM